jgi:hypothetical protein
LTCSDFSFEVSRKEAIRDAKTTPSGAKITRVAQPAIPSRERFQLSQEVRLAGPSVGKIVLFRNV